MENSRNTIRKYIALNKIQELTECLRCGLDPNFEGGWPIRLAARYGSFAAVKTLLQFGADPHLLSESGASTLQLAVFSGAHWDTNKWSFLLSCCDSSQLADGAAVAIVFQNVAALRRILETKRCNSNIPTTLTGKTLEQLAKGYKLSQLLNISPMEGFLDNVTNSPNARPSDIRSTLTPPHMHNRNLSPSVARFFHQSTSQSPSAVQRTMVSTSSTTSDFFNY